MTHKKQTPDEKRTWVLNAYKGGSITKAEALRRLALADIILASGWAIITKSKTPFIHQIKHEEHSTFQYKIYPTKKEALKEMVQKEFEKPICVKVVSDE